MREDSYVVIQAFMLDELHLKGNELIVYATIYGFTQDGSHWFHGTRGYLAEWCGAQRETVDRCLKSLLAKGFVERREFEDHGRTFVQYRATKNAGDTKKSSTQPEKTGATTTKNEHIKKIVEPKENLKNRGEFAGVIDAYATTDELRVALSDFVEARKQMKAPLTPKAMSMLLSKLDALAHDEHGKADVIKQSILNGWKGVFEVRGAKPRTEVPDVSGYNYF